MDRLTRTVREQVALGRLLPLGGATDAAWIAESAAVRALERAAALVPGVRLGPVSLALADPAGDGAAELPAVAPIGALPHAPVRIEAAFEASPDGPLPLAADRLRDALWDAAEAGVGIVVAAVDLRVTGLLDGERAAAAAEEEAGPERDEALDPGPEAPGPGSGAAGGVAAVVRTVPGVAGLTGRLSGLGSGVRIQDTAAPSRAAEGPEGPGPAASGRRVQVQIAVAAGHSPLAVARAVTAVVLAVAAQDVPGPVTTAVVVTDAG